MKKSISIIGGGASALILGCELNSEKYDITIYEKNNALGRKFLVAGDGGLNLTHTQTPANFIKQYTPYTFLQNAFSNFNNSHFITWLNNLGIKTFVGTSARVFPTKEYKPIDVLNALLLKIKNNSVALKYKYEWKGFLTSTTLIFENNNKLVEINSDYTIFCLGGSSWQVTGSNGNWANYFAKKNILILPFKASNCAFKINWSDNFNAKIEGKLLKNISLTCNTATHFGEIVFTKFGIEGSGVYPLSPFIREQLEQTKQAQIYIDFKPTLTIEKIIEKINSIINNKHFTQNLKTTLNLTPLHIQLLKHFLSKDNFFNPAILAQHIKKFKLNIDALAPMDKAISTVGGICLTEINSNFELHKLKNNFAIGEMLNYDAPTGGYLLQSCFSMGKYVADYLNKK